MFRALELCDKSIFDRYKTSGYNIHSQYNFTNLFMWKHEYQPVFDMFDDMLCVVIMLGGERAVLFPLGNEDAGGALDYTFSVFGNLPILALDDAKICYLCKYFGRNPVCEDVRSNYDYVYSTDKLIKLNGKKMHSKRNHLKRFIEGHSFEFKTVTCDNVVDCEYIEKKWIESKSGVFSEGDSSYISTMAILNNFDFLGCVGGIIYIDDLPAAFAIGEKMNDEVFVIHIEKAVGNYSGIYTAINQMCAEHIFYDCKYINREEDMGIDSLRKAKLSYYPEFMIQYKTARFTF